MTGEEVEQLFVPAPPGDPRPLVFGIRQLGRQATRKQVAKNIRKFVAWKKKN